MSCSTCGAANRSGAVFCRNCGRLLRANCPRCAAAAGPDANFCDTCGIPLGPRAWTGSWVIAGPQEVAGLPAVATPSSRPPPEVDTPPPAAVSAVAALPAFEAPTSLERFIPRELMAKLTATRGAAAERRVVTMLFCDIQGSTALAEKLDPEEWTEIVNGAFEQMVRPVYKYEGTVARLMGDGLLAFFGAPVAHEDDPRRAILAALAIVEGIHAWREATPAAREIDVRVGINTGLVVVGAVGSDLRLEYSAIGDAINLAARMEQTAAPGTVRIAEDTYRLVVGQFEVESLGGVVVKGKNQPVPAYRVVGRAGSVARRSAAFRAELVNRRMEWQAIERAFDAMGAGRGGIVFLTGDAGLGKTRLLDEAIERLLPALAPPGRLLEVSAVSYETTQPYALITRLLRQTLGLMAGDPPELIRERIAASAHAAEDFPVLEKLLGSASSPNGSDAEGEDFARRVDGVLERLWRDYSGGGPLVMALDELQWLDASSADRLAVLFHLTESAPILFLCALRRERRSPGWRLMEMAGRELPHRLAEVVLHPLSDGESRQMLAGLLDATDLPDALAAVILEKAEGNPLFLEEVVRHLIERGAIVRADGHWAANAAAEISLPDSLLALLTARIDRLDEATRRTLQVASIIGRTFLRSPLVALVDDPEAVDRQLSELQRMELVREVTRVPEPGYAFNHNLIQEAVYNTILLRQRRALHLRAAEVIMSLPGNNSAAITPILAYHYLEGEAPERALPHLLAAAGTALRLHATAEAVAYYERALPIALALPHDSERLTQIFTNRGRAFELQSRFAEAKAGYEEMERLSLERGDSALELQAVIAQGKLYANVTTFHDAARGRSLMERAITLAEASGDRVAEVRILWNLVNIDRFDVNSLDRAVANGERGVALARELALEEELAYLLNDLGELYGTAGRLDQADTYLTEARGWWRELGNEAMLADSLTSAAVWEQIKGYLQAALAKAEEAFAITSRIGNIWGEAYSQGVRGQILGWLGEVGRAMTDMSEAIVKTQQAGFVGGQILVNAFLSRVLLEMGAVDEAIAHARTGLEIGREQLPQFAGMCVGRLVCALLARGDIDAAAVAMDDPLGRQEKQQIFLVYDISLAEVELALAQGEIDKAMSLQAAAVGRASEIGGVSWIPDLLYAGAKIHMAAGRWDEAASALAEAVSRSRAMGVRGTFWRYLAAAAAVEDERGNADVAAALRAEAATESDYLAERILSDDLRATFLAQTGRG